MHVLVQWARGSPAGWEQATCAEITARAGARVPDGSESLAADDRRFLNCFNVQGNRGQADHYAFEELEDGSVIITQWNDDPDDWAPGDWIARRILLPPLRPDPKLGGMLNTAGHQTIYAGQTKFAELTATRANGTSGYANGTILPWVDFVPPAPAVTLHGIWMSDSLFATHRRAQTVRGWRQWCDHLPDEMCESVDGVRTLRAGSRVSGG